MVTEKASVIEKEIILIEDTVRITTLMLKSSKFIYIQLFDLFGF